MKILLLEDSSTDADLTRRSLSASIPDCRVETAPTLKEAKKLLQKKTPFDIALLDMKLPDGSGMDLLMEIRQSKMDMPVVMLTGSGNEELAVATLKAGADDYIVKRQDYLTILPMVVGFAIEGHSKKLQQRSEIINLLYVEHHSIDIDLTLRHLKKYAPNIHLDAVPTAEEALRLLPENETGAGKYHVILMDYRLPGLNALDFIKNIRQERKLCIPIILVTGQGNEEIAVQALKLGAYDYLMKNKNYLYRLPSLIVNAYQHCEIERQQAELTESESKYRLLAENSVFGIYIIQDAKMAYVNSSFAKTFGYSPEEIIDKLSPKNLIHPDDIQAVMKRFQERLDGQIERSSIVYKAIKKDGSLIYIEVYGIAIIYQGKSAVMGTLIDVTERKQAEMALRESEEIFRKFMEHSPIYVFFKDENIRSVRLSKNYESMLGKPMAELLGKNMDDLFPSELAKSMVANDIKILKENKEITIEEELNGRLYTTIKFPIHLEGKPRYLAGYTIDITERKIAEEQLRENERRLSTLMGNLPGIAYRCANDRNWTIEYVSEGCFELTGYMPEELVNNSVITFNDLIHEEDQEYLFNKWQDVLSRKETFQDEYRIITKNGKEKWVWEQGCGIYSDDDKVVALEGFIIDITERKLVTNELRKLSRAVEQSPVSILITDPEGNIEYANPKFSELTGYSLPEIQGKNPRFLKSGFTTQEEYAELWKTITSGGEWRGELCNKRKDGKLFWELGSISSIKNDEGQITHLLAVKEDISEKKKFEEELIKAKEKAEESDHLKTSFLHNISHEIRTPMNAITGFSSLLNNPGLSSDKIKDYTTIIFNSSHQLLSIITDIIHIATIEAGQEKFIEKEMNLNYLLNTLYRQFEAVAKPKDIRLILETPLNDSEVDILTDETKLSEILSNLINNALKFTQKGTVTISYAVKKTFLEFSVKDTGMGIPAGMHEKIFDRFLQVDHTVTREHEGTGLGLSISKAYVELLGGKIWVNSQPDKGSEFCFTIPFIRKSSDEISGSLLKSESELLFDQPKTILVAEDEDMNYLLVEEFLENPNITLLRARNGIEAVELFRSDVAIDLVLMDIKMPRMDGYEATRKIRAIKPDIPVIAITAYAQAGDKDKALSAGCSAYIAKPMRKEILLALIGKFLHKK